MESFFCFMRRPSPGSTLFPYTTLFRSLAAVGVILLRRAKKQDDSKADDSWSGFGSDARAGGDAPGQCIRAKPAPAVIDRKSTRLNSSHLGISYAVFCLKKKIHELNGAY